MNIEIAREQFEEAYFNKYQKIAWKHWDSHIQTYTDAHTNGAWWAWQASRAALVVELPDERSLSASDDPWYVREICKDAIEAAGIKVRP